MKHLVSLVLCSAVWLCANGQNLVPNPSFETYLACPTNAIFANNDINDWFLIEGHSGSVDYYNSCKGTSNPQVRGIPNGGWGGYQFARTGEAFIGLGCAMVPSGGGNYREYLQVQLNSPLDSGQTYCVSFYVNLQNEMKWTSDALGACFSIDGLAYAGINGGLVDCTYLAIENAGRLITDTLGWTLVSGYYSSIGGERFLTIGNFLHDTILNIQLFNDGGTHDKFLYFLIDDVTVTSDTLGCNAPQGIDNPPIIRIGIYPNPFQTYVTIESDQAISFVKLYDVSGKLILKKTNLSGYSVRIERNDLASGMYFIEVSSSNAILGRQKVIVQ